MAVDGRPLHGIHRDCGARAPGGRGLRAGLSVSLHVRCRRKALGLQGSMQLGRGAQALARTGASQRGDGRALPGELRQVPGARVTLEAVGTTSLESRLWSALAEVHEYHVFARKTRVDPLHQVGSVVAPDDDLAMAYARATYDEERWVEMMIVPQAAIISLWAPGGDS